MNTVHATSTDRTPGAQAPFTNINRLIIIGCLALIALLKVAGWFQGRWWVMRDADTPSYGQTACCTILLSDSDVAMRQLVHQSLSDHTDIGSRLDGAIESRAYNSSLFPLDYIKINARAESLGQIALTVRSHLATSFPSLRPEYRLGFASVITASASDSP